MSTFKSIFGKLFGVDAATGAIVWKSTGGLITGTDMTITPSVFTAGPAGATNVPGITLGGLLAESALGSITAGTTRTQAGATALTKEVNQVGTTTAPTAGTLTGDGVVLPVSKAGLSILVANTTSNPVQVYPSGTDTVNGTTTAVIQMQSSLCLYVCAASGAWQSEGTGTGYNGSYPTFTAVDSITAGSAGGSSVATLLPAAINRVVTVAQASASVLLPAAAAGMNISVLNAASLAIAVWPQATDNINSQATGTSFAIATNKSAEFFSVGPGHWHSILSVVT